MEGWGEWERQSLHSYLAGVFIFIRHSFMCAEQRDDKQSERQKTKVLPSWPKMMLMMKQQWMATPTRSPKTSPSGIIFSQRDMEASQLISYQSNILAYGWTCCIQSICMIKSNDGRRALRRGRDSQSRAAEAGVESIVLFFLSFLFLLFNIVRLDSCKVICYVYAVW